MEGPQSPSFCSLSARYLVDEALKPLRHGPPPSPLPIDWDGDFRSIPSENRPDGSLRRREFKVCIIGAGVAGLRVAMFLQRLNVDFDILEASDRHGGRAFTYHFSRAKHDYYDVGAMRFPKIKALEQTFNLFTELKLDEDGKIIPYIMSIPENIQLFNDVRVTNAEASALEDPHKDSPAIPLKCLTYRFKELRGAAAIAAEAMEPFKVALVADFQTGWKELMQFDHLTTRDFMSWFVVRHNLTTHPFPVVQWMERMNSSTGSYNFAFSQSVLESIEFDYPGGSRGGPGDVQQWACVDGGTEVVTDRMQASIKKKLDYNHRVVAIRAEKEDKKSHCKPPEMFVDVQGYPGFENAPYAHIVVTTPLSCLNRMDLTKAGLYYHQRDGIRSLSYGSAVKIGIKFRTKWWEMIPEYKQMGGVSYTDRPIRVVVYPSYGIGDPPDDSGVLIASYAWTQDASRLGADIQGNRSVPEQHLLDIVYNNLAAMHGETAQWYREETISHYAHDWYHDEFTAGAYAQFQPGQYSYLYPEMTKPAAGGYLHFSGEAMSAHHAWIEGALVAAWRSVYQILVVEGRDDLVRKFTGIWPPPEEIDISNEPWQVVRGVYGLQVEADE